jgi:hypothetical protein
MATPKTLGKALARFLRLLPCGLTSENFLVKRLLHSLLSALLISPVSIVWMFTKLKYHLCLTTWYHRRKFLNERLLCTTPVAACVYNRQLNHLHVRMHKGWSSFHTELMKALSPSHRK